jgi:Ran GTPase-activating protein (RanGAP) involved in mRNA processing and transport
MKTEKGGTWTMALFKLFSEDLAYFSPEKTSERLGAVSLNEPGTTVILLKPEKNADDESVYPIKLKLKSGMQFYLATSNKKDRKDWAAIINGRITNFAYLAITEEQGVRADPRCLNLTNAPADCPSVYLDNGELSDESLQAVGSVLPFLENVNVVSFANTELSDADITILSEGLGKASVHVLKLTGNQLTDTGAQQLSTILASSRNLDELDVSGNKIGDAGAKALATLFSAKNPLKALNIESNNISDAGITDVCAALKGATVPILRFGDNSISDVGVAAIASLIKANATILELQLGTNSITDSGVEVLSEALKGNTSILKVDLSKNAIGPGGVAALHNVFKENKVIRHIDLSDNSEIMEGQALAASMSADASIAVSSLAFSRYQ